MLQDSLHKILHALLANQNTREQAISYLARVVADNADRAKMGCDRRLVASDDFMSNFVSVMYRLAAKIPMEKVRFRFLEGASAEGLFFVIFWWWWWGGGRVGCGSGA